VNALRIALADDQALVRGGLRALLGDLRFVVAVEASDGEELLQHLQTEAVDVLVCDVRMPRRDGLSAVRALRDRGDRTPAILLTTFDDEDLVLRAVEAGAQGFLLKDAAPGELHEAIQLVAGGGTLLQPRPIDPIRDRYAYRDASPPEGRFGDREVAILRLMAGGYSNREIARAIHLAPGTVKNYVSDILAKLDARDRTQAVLKAITLRVI
jgi:DNA-binding NarL/FixJ family response regulator